MWMLITLMVATTRVLAHTHDCMSGRLSRTLESAQEALAASSQERTHLEEQVRKAIHVASLCVHVNLDTTNALGVPKLTQLFRYTEVFVVSTHGPGGIDGLRNCSLFGRSVIWRLDVPQFTHDHQLQLEQATQ